MFMSQFLDDAYIFPMSRNNQLTFFLCAIFSIISQELEKERSSENSKIDIINWRNLIWHSSEYMQNLLNKQ